MDRKNKYWGISLNRNEETIPILVINSNIFKYFSNLKLNIVIIISVFFFFIIRIRKKNSKNK